MNKFDVIVIGAGPAGITAALRLARSSRSVLLVDTGGHYQKRYCPADNGLMCKGCGGICNVIAGFGGSMHYGDGVKLSMFPSGRRLAALLGQAASTLQDAAIDLLFGDDRPIFTDALQVHGPFDVKRYPVAYVSSSRLEHVIERLYSELTTCDMITLALSTTAHDLYPASGGWRVELDSAIPKRSRLIAIADKVIVAVGRRGINWWRKQVRRLGIAHARPTPSVGVRFECPSELLSAGSAIHPDFKTTVVRNGVKVKTFCFCAGLGGGRVKFTDYGDHTLLDGHVIPEPGVSSVSNFALLAQLRGLDGTPHSYEWIDQHLLGPYRRLRNDRSGNPVLQWYPDFKADTLKCTTFAKFKELAGFTPTMRDYALARVSSLFSSDIRDAFCSVFEELMEFFLPGGFVPDRHGSQIGVVGLELEGLWDELAVTPEMQTSLHGLYTCGDCAGVAQGILQAAVSGLAAASDVIAPVRPSRFFHRPAMTNRWISESVELARDIFGSNLRLAFIGGSYAAGIARSRSDIDLFIVMHVSDPLAETSFARQFRQLHEEAGLDFGHCGELFDTTTLCNLLDFTDLYLRRFPDIQHSACYQADCLLSVFRKGDIAYKFLNDPKLLTVGDITWLEEMEKRAMQYFEQFPLPRFQHQKGKLRMLPGSPQAELLGKFTSRLHSSDLVDTPVGVGLHRWFGTPLILRQTALLQEEIAQQVQISSRFCPLDPPIISSDVVRLVGRQCLAIDICKGEPS